ncbi:hypothetical protein [Streptomyces nigrescens]|nr:MULTISPECIES: hypothetical protein [Streptomyces]MCX5449482.1 hypothetical protein [Streptomyces libani]WAU02266.1 hypothetical protein STRNI_000283 [Streptomyces nigrescens]
MGQLGPQDAQGRTIDVVPRHGPGGRLAGQPLRALLLERLLDV